jgi:hypothetical protein
MSWGMLRLDVIYGREGSGTPPEPLEGDTMSSLGLIFGGAFLIDL